MRSGDVLLVLIIAASLALIAADGATGGAVQAWIAANLSAVAAWSGDFLVLLGLVLSPLLAMPLVLLIWGRVSGLPPLAERVLTRTTQMLDAISETLSDAVRWFALALVIVTVVVVIQRYVFGNSSTKLQESVIYLHSLLFLLSAGATLLHGGHVRVDVIYSKLSDQGKAWTDLFGYYLALVPMGVLILSTSRSYVSGAWRVLESSRESDGLPLVFALKTAIPLFAVLLILQGFAMTARAVLTLCGREAPVPGEPARREL